jgi:RNA 3'-terminal phosphate cyclase (ATP)
MVDKCVRGLVSEIRGCLDDDGGRNKGESKSGSATGKEKKEGKKKCCVDEHMRDQVVVFEELGKVFAAGKDGEEGASEEAEEEEEEGLTLHTKTAMWVCKQILGER